MGTPTANTRVTRGGRGARERILRAADRLFYQNGIHATGVAALTAEAHVSTRTFYQHFETKNALVEAYLRRHEDEAPIPSEMELERAELTAAERLLAIFKPLDAGGGVLRGCPFHNAAVESAGELPGVTHLVEKHKKRFLNRIITDSVVVNPDRRAKLAQPTRRASVDSLLSSTKAQTRSRPPATTTPCSRTRGRPPKRSSMQSLALDAAHAPLQRAGPGGNLFERPWSPSRRD